MRKMDHYNITDLIQRRADQASYHVSSERHIRVEFRNMSTGEKMGPFRYEGDLIVTCFGGAFSLSDGQNRCEMIDHEQAVVPEGATVELECREQGTVQIIWAPAHAKTTRWEQLPKGIANKPIANKHLTPARGQVTEWRY